MIGGLGALVILLFVFGTLPAVLMPLAVAVAAILNTFTLVWALTYITDVSIIVQFLIALVGLGVAIDYALLMIFRFRDELREGEDVETALVETMTHAGRSVIVSGSTVAVGLLSMVILPLPFIRSIGHRRDADPGRLGARGDHAACRRCSPCSASGSTACGSCRSGSSTTAIRRTARWGRWARFVLRRPWPVALGRARDRRRARRYRRPAQPERVAAQELPRAAARRSRAAQMLADAGISPGVMKPFDVLVENGGDARRRRREGCARSPGIVGAAAPPARLARSGDDSLVEAFPAIDGAAPGIQAIIDRVNARSQGTDGTLGGVAGRRPRLHPRDLRQLPVRARVRPHPDAASC